MAHNSWPLSMNHGLLYGIVAKYFRLLGFPGGLEGHKASLRGELAMRSRCVYISSAAPGQTITDAGTRTIIL